MIYRDGELLSLWQDNIEPYIARLSANKNTVYDIIIVGGGITGITTGLLLQKAGMQCLIMEARNICFGTTGGTTAHINTLLDTPYTTIQKNFNKDSAELVASAAKDAIDLIRRNIAEYQIDCSFQEVEAFLFAEDEDQEKQLKDIWEATNDAGVKAVYAETIPLNVEFKRAIRVGQQAKFNPVQYVYGLAKAFENAGGIILQDCRVTGAENNEVVEVETSRGIFKAKNLLYATHIPPGVNLLHLRCIPYRSYAMAVRLKDGLYPEQLVYDMHDPYHYYRSQEVNGEMYLIAGGKDHKTAHEDNTEQRLRELEAHIRTIFDVDQIFYGWSSQYFESADGLPYIGHLPGNLERIFVATGFGGNGMTYSHVAALTIKEILLNEETKYSRLFNPNRIKPVAGFINFIKHNADVVKQFAGKWFPSEELQQLADLAPGEGKIVSYNKHKLAVYKDEDGEVHAINPICQHLKCEVKWNGAETSWDCPCHGARYSIDGRLLTGPADGDLEKIEVRHLIEK